MVNLFGALLRFWSPLLLLAIGWTGILRGADPTADEQYWLELINRARSDPPGELERLTNYASPTTFAAQASDDPNIAASLAAFGTDASLLADQWATLQTAPPLAWSAGLANTATTYSQLMISSDAQSHTLDGIAEQDLDLRLVGGTGYGANWADLGENLYAGAQSVLHGHAGFLIDWGDENGPSLPGYGSGIQSPADHRVNVLYYAFKEVGIGLVTNGIPGTNTNATGPYVVTQHFGNQFVQAGLDLISNAILTGVVYEDNLLADHFYSPGEGLGGVPVDVYVNGSLAPVFSGVTNAVGGYNIELAGLVTGDQVHVVAPTTGLVGQDFTIDSSTLSYGSQSVTFYDNLHAAFEAVPTPVPEPSGLFSIASVALFFFGRRRRVTALKSV
jgi:uncharacterized protein YkwD